MVIRKVHSLKWWLTVACILLFIALALPIGVGIWYTQATVQHECAALNLILSQPTVSTENATQRQFDAQFRLALTRWAKEDGC